ncbi:MAG: iron ABC transporter permease, partial [archaeon]|nr:iron ABC transporter permease [archaeon]
KLNILSVEEDSARSMGVDTTVYRTICLVTVSIVTAVTVSFCGVIGFIGLVAPHVVRHFIGSDNRFVIPSAAAFGAVFILFCDVVSRIVSPTGSEIPVGVVMSFIGAPIFLCIIIRTRRDLW